MNLIFFEYLTNAIRPLNGNLMGKVKYSEPIEQGIIIFYPILRDLKTF